MISPTVAIGDGRTYASAARNPGALVSSGGASDAFEDMEGVLSLSLIFPGFTVDSIEKSFFARGPAFKPRLEDESFVGEGGSGERGNGWSSKEKIDRSSPFH
jgi:hypothetical protein